MDLTKMNPKEITQFLKSPEAVNAKQEMVNDLEIDPIIRGLLQEQPPKETSGKQTFSPHQRLEQKRAQQLYIIGGHHRIESSDEQGGSVVKQQLKQVNNFQVEGFLNFDIDQHQRIQELLPPANLRRTVRDIAPPKQNQNSVQFVVDMHQQAQQRPETLIQTPIEPRRPFVAQQPLAFFKSGDVVMNNLHDAIKWLKALNSAEFGKFLLNEAHDLRTLMDKLDPTLHDPNVKLLLVCFVSRMEPGQARTLAQKSPGVLADIMLKLLQFDSPQAPIIRLLKMIEHSPDLIDKVFQVIIEKVQTNKPLQALLYKAPPVFNQALFQVANEAQKNIIFELIGDPVENESYGAFGSCCKK